MSSYESPAVDAEVEGSMGLGPPLTVSAWGYGMHSTTPVSVLLTVSALQCVLPLSRPPAEVH